MSNPWQSEGNGQGHTDFTDGAVDSRDEHLKVLLAEEVAQRYGEAAVVRANIVISLVEHPRADTDGPGEPRFRVMLKSLDAVAPEVATRMLMDAQVIFKRQLARDEDRIR